MRALQTHVKTEAPVMLEYVDVLPGIVEIIANQVSVFVSHP